MQARDQNPIYCMRANSGALLDLGHLNAQTPRLKAFYVIFLLNTTIKEEGGHWA